MANLLNVIVPVFLVMGLGAFAVRVGIFSDADIEALMKFTQTFAIPFLLFSAISNLDLSQALNWALLASFYTGAAGGFLIGLLGAHFIFRRPWEDSVAIGFCGLFSNTVLLGLPIMQRAYGVAALAPNFAIIAFHSPFGYGLGFSVMETVRSHGRGSWHTAGAIARAMFRNPLVIGILLGFAVNISGLTLPKVATDAVDMMVGAALPAALFGLGGVLVRYRPDGDMSTIAFICAVSLIVHPALTWGMGRALHLSQGEFRSAVLTAAMAPGVNAYIFANIYGAAKRVAASAVLFGTMFSLVTVSFWLMLLG